MVWHAAVFNCRRKRNLNTTLAKDKFAPILKEVVDTYAKTITTTMDFA